MAITYSFPVIIQKLPSMPIPYQKAERKFSVSNHTHKSNTMWQLSSAPNARYISSYSTVSVSYKTTNTSTHTMDKVQTGSKPATPDYELGGTRGPAA